MLRFFFRSFVLFLTLYSLFSNLLSLASAQQEFTVNFDTTYNLNIDGSADVVQAINLANNFSKIYASSYTLMIEGKKPGNIKALQNKIDLPVNIEEGSNNTKINITFPDAVVGRDKSRVFEVKYTVNGVAIRNGKVWDLTIPKLGSGETINKYNLKVIVPTSFGQPAYISPQPTAKSANEGKQYFEFNKDDIVRAGVVGAFGDFQVFTFDINYHLQNTEPQEVEKQIALPPDTAFQKVYYKELEPKPIKIEADTDGNWLASYKLQPGQKLDIRTSLAIQVFASPQEHYLKIVPYSQNYYLGDSKYWQVDDGQIRQLGQTLKTPRAIYEFVANKLNYNYSRVRENVPRLGAIGALNNPDQAICTEFTDLFIAIARSAGIPAREINGYAYTQNPQIQPLSLVADVLHAWPEYWDETRNAWIPIDPTWADTTGGINYFDKFDLSHITFAIHGKDTLEPFPAGAYKTGDNNQKDLQVNFGSLPQDLVPDLSISIKPTGANLSLRTIKKIISVENPGPAAVYDIPVAVASSEYELTSVAQSNIDFLAPFSQSEVPVEFKAPFIPRETNGKLSVLVGEKRQDLGISNVSIYLPRILIFFSFLLFSVTIALLPRIVPKIRDLIARLQ